MADQEPFEISSQRNVPKEGNMTIDLSTITLAHGMHDTLDDGMCLLEAAAYLAGEPHSDHPQCVCPVLAAFGRSWNDSLDDETRNRLLKPFLPRLLNTRSTPDVQDRRAFMAADWAVRTYTPAWLRLAGLNDHADALADLPELTSVQAFRDARAVTQASRMAAAAAWAAARDAVWDAARDAVWDAAWDAARAAAWDAVRAVAWDAAWDAAWDVARDAAWDAARAAAWDAAWDAARAATRAAAWDAARAAAWDAARDAAWDATRAAAWDAARAAARAALAPTRDALQASAADLFDRMTTAA